MTVRSPPHIYSCLGLSICMALVAGPGGLGGCASGQRASTSPYNSASEDSRDPAKAQRLTMEAAEIMHKDPEKAEKLLREAAVDDDDEDIV